MQHGSALNTPKAQKLSRQASGILRKVDAMIEEDAYCPNIIQQVDAVIGCLASLRRELLSGHLEHCLAHKMLENKEKTIKELMKLYNIS